MAEQLIEESRRQGAAIREKLAASNSKLRDRIKEEGLEVSYARDIDYLYVTIGLARESLSIPADDDVRSVVLYDPDTYEITAWEVPSFMAKMKAAKQSGDFWLLIADLIRDHGDTLYIPADKDARRAEQALRHLAFA